MRAQLISPDERDGRGVPRTPQRELLKTPRPTPALSRLSQRSKSDFFKLFFPLRPAWFAVPLGRRGSNLGFDKKDAVA